jgi:ribonuclease P protein component
VPRAGVASLSERSPDEARFRQRDRLAAKADFDRVLRERSIRVNEPPFNALASASPAGYPRLGLIVPKRHCPNAVDRNRIKRLAREAFRVRRARLAAIDIVIQLTRAPGDADPRVAMERLWRRLERPSGEAAR